jgi:RimJ/RimL family protein N-acetyltransferase
VGRPRSRRHGRNVGLDDIADGRATLGYWIEASRRGRGLATVAARVVLAEAFTVMGLQQVVANALPHNHPSLAVLRHLGFDAAGSVVLEMGGEHLRFVLFRGSWISMPTNSGGGSASPMQDDPALSNDEKT